METTYTALDKAEETLKALAQKIADNNILIARLMSNMTAAPDFSKK